MSSEAFVQGDTHPIAEVGDAVRRRRLSAPAVAHLSHDLRGALHTVLGHSELLTLDTGQEARDSAQYIHEAAERLLGMCDDITDLLLLPDLLDRGEMALSLDALVAALTPLAESRGSRLRVLESGNHRHAVVVDATVLRIVSHAVEHVVRSASSDVTLGASLRAAQATCVVTVAPVSEALAGDDGVFAILASLLAARGGQLRLVGWRLELLIPVAGRDTRAGAGGLSSRP